MPGRSIRKTSAPMSANNIAQKGPGASPAISTTFNPVKGPISDLAPRLPLDLPTAPKSLAPTGPFWSHASCVNPGRHRKDAPYVQSILMVRPKCVLEGIAVVPGTTHRYPDVLSDDVAPASPTPVIVVYV